MMGKSIFDSYEDGRYKLIHIGQVNTSNGNDHKGFFRYLDSILNNKNVTVDYVNDCGNQINDEVNIDVEKTDYVKNDNIDHLKKDITDLGNSESSTNMSENHQTQIIPFEDFNTTDMEMKLPHIRWGVKKTNNLPGIINTCAIDSILCVMYYAIGMNKMWCEFINNNDKVLKTVMNLMNHQLHDKARFLLAKANKNFLK